jgi:CO/xanthine dehydrogenase Mo-binding subunit
LSTSLTLEPAGRVGDRVAKLDAREKVQGTFEYSSDMNVPGMLHACAVRSPHAHARILQVDVAAAASMTGVHAVLTADDVPGRKTFGLEVADQPVLAWDRVRYQGEAVAIVAAEDPGLARRAAAAVVVEYEPLAPLGDPKLALESEPLHDDPPKGDGWRDDGRPNVIRTVVVEHGDPSAEAEVVVSNLYEVGRQDPAFLGPESGLAIPDGAGGVDLHVATQWLHQDLHQLLASLDLTREQMRIHLAGVGGAFGGREDISGQIHACMLALRTGRAVRWSYPRDESFIGHVHRHPALLRMEHRATREGTLVCVHANVILDGGAYASGSPSVTFNAATMTCGPYLVPNAHIEATTVYTNNPPAGAMRGFGVVQTCYASEAQMDVLAKVLGMDPVELRVRNALKEGDILPTGDRVIGKLPVVETIRACAELPMPEPEGLPRDPVRLPGGAGNTTVGEGIRRGNGFAVTYKNACYSGGYDDYSYARVRLFRSGEDHLPVAEVQSAAVEFGQGLTNVLVQVVQTELDVSRVELLTPTTHDVDSSGSTSASRQTWMSSGAVKMCCDGIREELDARGGSLGDGEEIVVERVYHHTETSPLEPEKGQVVGERSHVGYSVAAMKAVVEVDVDLGLTRVVWIGTAQDVGRAINPAAVEGQIEGGIAQGLGLAMMEEILTEDGVIRNASFTDYLIPTMLDMPPVDISLLEIPHEESPYGIRGVGEAPTIVSTAAIASALRNATGLDLPRAPVRLTDIAGLAPDPLA